MVRMLHNGANFSGFKSWAQNVNSKFCSLVFTSQITLFDELKKFRITQKMTNIQKRHSFSSPYLISKELYPSLDDQRTDS